MINILLKATDHVERQLPLFKAVMESHDIYCVVEAVNKLTNTILIIASDKKYPDMRTIKTAANSLFQDDVISITLKI